MRNQNHFHIVDFIIKLASIIVIISLIANMVLFALHKISLTLFWVGIAIGLAIAYALPKLRNKIIEK
jgi:hypothetical protein